MGGGGEGGGGKGGGGGGGVGGGGVGGGGGEGGVGGGGGGGGCDDCVQCHGREGFRWSHGKGVRPKKGGEMTDLRARKPKTVPSAGPRLMMVRATLLAGACTLRALLDTRTPFGFPLLTR